jgi:hypothetical protein
MIRERGGLGGLHGPVGCFSSYSFFFFLETLSSFLAAFFREKKRRFWKDLQTGYKT